MKGQPTDVLTRDHMGHPVTRALLAELEARVSRTIFNYRNLKVPADLPAHERDCDCRGCSLSMEITDLHLWFVLRLKEERATELGADLVEADPTLHEILNEPRYSPSFALRLIARRWPLGEWLVLMPANERVWHVQGQRGEYVKQSFLPFLPDWAWEAIRYEP